jgi:hypothetical protein
MNQRSQAQIAQEMDDYYRQCMAEMLTTQKEAQALESKRLKDEHAKELEQWNMERTMLEQQAEKGYQELYANIHNKHDATISMFKTELQKARDNNVALRQQCVIILTTCTFLFVSQDKYFSLRTNFLASFPLSGFLLFSPSLVFRPSFLRSSVLLSSFLRFFVSSFLRFFISSFLRFFILLFVLFFVLPSPISLFHPFSLSFSSTSRVRLASQVTLVQNEAERVRIGHEKQVQERCDTLIGQYRAIAEQATAQIGTVRQQAEIKNLDTIRLAEEERAEFESQVMQRAQGLVRSAKAEAKLATEKLEEEREKFAKFEVEVRRQFEAHCRNFEGQLRAKAVRILATHNVNDTNDIIHEGHSTSSRDGSGVSAAAASSSQQRTNSTTTTIPSSPLPTGSSPSPASSPNDDRVRKTVAELKSYMATLKLGANTIPFPSNETKQRQRADTLAAARLTDLHSRQQHQHQQHQHQQHQQQRQQQHRGGNGAMIDAYAELRQQETTNQFRTLNSLY